MSDTVRCGDGTMGNEDLKARGVSRDTDERNVVVCFNRRVTDNELRWLHEHLRKGIPHRFQTSKPGCDDCDYSPFVDYSEPDDEERDDESWVDDPDMGAR